MMFSPFAGRPFNEHVGFEHPAHRRRAMARRAMPVPELVATLALVICTLLAMTVVSIEIAQADSFSFGTDDGNNPLALAGCLALLLTVMGGITAAATRMVRHD